MPSWDSFDPMGTDSALGFMERNPLPATERKPSAWGQIGEALVAPFKGAAQAAGQTARSINRVAPLQAGNPLAMSASEQEELLDEGNVTREGQDRALRSSIDAFKPDPLTSTTASMILQDAGRLLTKVAGYSIMGGPVAAIAGTGVDEGLTGFMEMRDRGVDAGTAAKAGAVRGVATAVGVALPVAGNTAAQTAGLILAGGPASFMAEQAITREILESADYPELAAEHDPFDPVGLGVSTLVPGVFGTAVHRARVRRAAAEAAGRTPPAELPPGFADTPEVRDAAHVAYRDQQIDAAMLGDRTDPRAHADHANAVQAARQALDDAQAVQLDPDMALDPARTRAVIEDMQARLQRADDEIMAARTPDDRLTGEPGIRVKRDSADSTTYEILDQSGNPVGSILTLKASTSGGDGLVGVLRIHNSGIDVPEAMGQGYAAKAYQDLVDQSLAAGKQVWSDTSVTPDAQRLYESLRRKGYVVEENAARPPTREQDGTLTTTGSYVYRIAKREPLRRERVPVDDKLDNLAAAAMRFVDDQSLQGVDTLPPEVTNMIVGLRENGGKVADLLDQVREIRDAQRGEGDLPNWIADAVEQARANPQAQVSPELRKGLQAARQFPDMPVRLDDDAAPAQRAADVMEKVSHERRRARVEARAFDAAVECLLEFGP